MGIQWENPNLKAGTHKYCWKINFRDLLGVFFLVCGFDIFGIPENERECYLEVPRFESQTTLPYH